MAKVQPQANNDRSFSLRLRNFRAFRDSEAIRIAPFTCFVGRNSSGKSSVISALLLLRQSIDRRALGAETTPLALSGKYCDLGGYNDVVHGHNTNDHIGFDFTFSMRALLAASRESGEPLIQLELPVNNDTNYYPRYFTDRAPLKAYARSDASAKLSLEFKDDEPYGPSLSRLEIAVEGIGSISYVRTVGTERKQHWRLYIKELPSKSVAIRFYSYSFFPLISASRTTYKSLPQSKRFHLRKFLTTANLMFRRVIEIVSNIAYVGPFRTPPERRYAFSGFSALTTGITGKEAVELLIAETLLKPSNHCFLNVAVSFWLNHLGLAKDLTVNSIAKKENIFQLTFQGAGGADSANFADVGFGISQILPVLVQGMLMASGSTYVVQQPEIHLHPDAQAGLVDFFAYLSCRGVTVLVETHSEYFLVRLRRRLAECAVPMVIGLPSEAHLTGTTLTASDVSVQLTEACDDGSEVRELHISKNFQFDNLPIGFMNQASEDRVQLLKTLGSPVPDNILDASVVILSNADLAERIPGSSLDVRLTIIEEVGQGIRHMRFNGKLRDEYLAHIRESRNDAIEILLGALDNPSIATFVEYDQLPKEKWIIAKECSWPSHDQHLLAAAMEGHKPVVFVTEHRLSSCHSKIYRKMRISVANVA